MKHEGKKIVSITRKALMEFLQSQSVSVEKGTRSK